MYFPDRGCVHTLLTLYVYINIYAVSASANYVMNMTMMIMPMISP